MPQEERKRLMEDVPKMTNMVDSVATYLADILQITDDEVDTKTPFVEVSRKELHYLISLSGDGRVRQMDNLMRMYDFCVKAEHLANRMRSCSIESSGENMDITNFSHEEAYYGGDQLISEGTTRTTIDVGDIGQHLMSDVCPAARKWLDELDPVLCECSSISRTDAAGNDQGLVHVKNYLAFAIAERLTLMSYENVLDDCLSSRSLTELLNRVYDNSKKHAGAEKSKDASLARLLLTLASDPYGEDARDILENGIDQLREMMTSLPKELESRSQEINLERLSRAFSADLDLECRVALTSFWADNSTKACSAISAALKEILNWQPIEKVVQFRSILTRGESGRAVNEFMIPFMKFLYTPRFFACKQPERRSGLPEAAARSECLIRAVWELASRGVFQGGVLSADIVNPVALDAILMARFAAKRIADERDLNKLGFKMSNFVSKLYDMEGDFVRILDKATCNLSFFSCKELETVFDTRGESLAFLCGCLTARTQSLMTYSPNKTYTSFATDALAILLPLIQHRRERLGISSALRPNAFIDILRTIPRMHKWQPTQGALRLTLEDLKSAHPLSRRILDELHEHNTMVKRHGSESSKRKITYTFDTYQLWKIMTEKTAFLPI